MNDHEYLIEIAKVYAGRLKSEMTVYESATVNLLIESRIGCWGKLIPFSGIEDFYYHFVE